MERTKILLKVAPEEFQKQIFREITKSEERLSEEEMELLVRSRVWKECAETGTRKQKKGQMFATQSDVTRTAGSGSQTSEMEAELLSPEVSDQKEQMGLSEKKQNLEERTWNKRTPKWREGERSLLLLVVSLVQQEADLKLLKWRLDLCLQRRIFVERQWRCGPKVKLKKKSCR